MRKRFIVVLINAANEVEHVMASDDPIADSRITEAFDGAGVRIKYRIVRLEVGAARHIRAREWINALTVAGNGALSCKAGFDGEGFDTISERDERT